MSGQARSLPTDEKEVKCIVQTYRTGRIHQSVHVQKSRHAVVHSTQPVPQIPVISSSTPFLPRKALAHKRRIRHGVGAGASRREVQLVRAVEPARGPADVAQEDVGVLVQEGELLADVLLARVRVAAARLGEHGLAVVGAEPFCEWGEGVVDVVGCAFCRGAGVVALYSHLSVLGYIEGSP